MTKDDIAQMMQDSSGMDWGTEAHFQRFAALVAAAEREACAKLFDGPVWSYDYREIAAAIRARGQA